MRIEEAKAKRARHAEAAIIRRAAAEADDDLADSAARCIEQHLAGAEGARDAVGSRLSSGHAPQTRRFAHFHDGRCAALDRAIARPHDLAERIVHLAFVPLAASRASRSLRAVPSPPSAIGSSVISASGRTSAMPAAIASATAAAPNEPLNLSGATGCAFVQVRFAQHATGDAVGHRIDRLASLASIVIPTAAEESLQEMSRLRST